MTAAQQGTNPDQCEENGIFAQLVNVLGPNFRIECRISTKRSETGLQANTIPPECLTSAEDVDLLLYYLHEVITTPYQEFIIERIKSESESCQLIVFESFYFPLLHKLFIRLEETDPEDTYLRSLYEKLFVKVLTSYIHRYVQPEPTVTGNMTRQPDGCGSRRCANCTILDNFLANPKLKTKAFPVGRAERHHLHSVLEGTGNSHDTNRSMGDTLIVTKKSSSEDKKHEEWKKRFEVARKLVFGLNQESLLALLRQEEYNKITTLSDVRKGSRPKQQSAKPPAQTRPPIEIIDLT